MTMTPLSAHANDALITLFEQHGCARVDTPVLQPAELFLDLSGEDIRRRLFLTIDQEGREMCLRPEYTIPVCRRHLEAGQGGAEYCYLGPVFRQRVGESGEFLQAGVESIGRDDIAPADADVIGLAVDGLALYCTGPLDIRIGDMGLLEALMRALAVPSGTRRRLLREIAAGRPLDEMLAPEPRATGSDHAGLLAAIEGQDPRAARAFVEDVLSIAGISRVGGRSAGEIAERFLSRAENRSGTLADEARQVLAAYLAIDGDLDGAAAAIRDLARRAGIDITQALDIFEERTGFMAARGLAVETFHFKADFARSLDYYTGFIFEIRDRDHADGRLIAAGGRYDRLLDHLGSSGPIPAVGCSLWLDRIEGGQR